MDYKEKYEKALGVAKTYHDCNNGKPFSCNAVGLTEAIFPELGESEDEKIRKGLIDFLKSPFVNENITDEKVTPWIAWIEKQGEQPNKVSIWKHWKDGIAGNGDKVPTYLIRNGSTYSISSCLGFECDYIELSDLDKLYVEKQGQQSDEKVEPMFNFKVGQWIVATGKCVYLITKIDGFNVTFVDTNGDEYVFDVSSLDDAHLWTIQDAKDGDVLANKYGAIFINAGTDESRVTLDSYCYISIQGKFYIEDHKTGSWFYKDDVKPATKEQCDLLFQKMKEAGYEWDAEKKELKKIEQKPNFCHHEVDLSNCSEEYRKAYYDGWNNCNQQHAQLKAEQKPWNEEDEKVMTQIIHNLEKYTVPGFPVYVGGVELAINWLKSLKGRMKGE